MNRTVKLSHFRYVLKKIFDLFISFLLLILLSPLLAVTAAAIFLRDGGSPFVIEKAVGKDAEIFSYPQFRLSMPILKCLPALICILLGHMSFVGPQPLLICESEKLKQRFMCGAHTVKPGITGLAQIYGDSEDTADSLPDLDALYAAGWSLSLDLQILGIAVKCMFDH